MFKYTMTIPQFMEYEKLKEKYPKFNECDLYSAIIGSGLCLFKTLSENLGFNYLAYQFLLLSKGFFWFLIFVSIIKGMIKTCHLKTRKAGVYQLIGSSISSVIMLYFN